MSVIQSSLFDPLTTMSQWIQQKAAFSPCRSWRYMLCRSVDPTNEKALLVIGLNPSTADETQDDPTIRRCMALARRQGCGVLLMGNLFAWRATDPQNLYKATYPVGEDNTEWLLTMAEYATCVICAWGNHGEWLHRGYNVARTLRKYNIPLFCLGITKQGQPKHPLYLPNSTAVVPWLIAEEEKPCPTPA